MTPLVFVHGFLGGSDQWVPQEELAEGRDLIRVDLPGFGRNAHLDPIHSIPDFADWVLAELTRQNVDRFDLLGHSMGGMIVQEMVLRAPDRVRRLILYATGSIGVLPGRFEPIETSIERAAQDGAVSTARRIAATWFSDGTEAEHYAACAAIAEKARLPALISGLRAMQTWSGQSRLSEIDTETLILWGDKDQSYPWSQIEILWQSISKSHLAVLPGCAHAVHLEWAGLFNQIVEDFLDQR